MYINIQPISKPDIGDGGTLLVHSIFHTIQGEGPLTGKPAIFIRLSDCNLQCPMCDTEYTEGARTMSVEAISAEVRKLHPGPRLVVITGGEPFRQNITPLCFALIDEDYKVQVETNGSLPPPPGLPINTSNHFMPGVWIVVSPKAGRVHPATAFSAVAWKYVLDWRSYDPEDGLPIRALNHTAHPRVARPPQDFPREAIYVQPADTKNAQLNEENLRSVVRSCMRHGYTVQLQTHKILNVE